MRGLTDDEAKTVSGGILNVSKQVTVVKAGNASVSVKQKVVQRNGLTLVDYTRVVVH